MDTAIALSLALSGAIGLALGVFGGGGSILAVPMLVYVTRVAPPAAIGMSLAIVGATSLATGYAHHLRGQVRPKAALLFGGSGITTAFAAPRFRHVRDRRGHRRGELGHHRRRTLQRARWL